MFKINKLTTFLIVGALAFIGKAAVVQASETPVAGIAVVLDEFYNNADATDEVAVNNLLEEIKIQNSLAFADVSNYVNIRDKASEEGEIVGKLYDNAVATILDKEDGWYKIKSGSVTGYIKGEFLVTGEKAVSIAKEVGNRIAVVNTTTLKVRKEASTDSIVLTLIAIGDDLKVTKELDGWVEVQLEENSFGYVSMDYVILQTSYEEAVSIEEEQQRLAEEEANLQSQNASNVTSGNSASSGSYNISGSTGNSISDYAIQFIGNPYVWGGTSLTNGADCSGFTQSVLRHFGISIPRTSRSQATGGTRVSLENIRPGDLLFYAQGGTINHVAIYIGNGKIVAASTPATGIRISNYNYRTPVKAVRYN